MKTRTSFHTTLCFSLLFVSNAALADKSAQEKIVNAFALLDTNIKYFENKIGIAKYITELDKKREIRKYEIENCVIETEVTSNSITRVTLNNISTLCDYKPSGSNKYLSESNLGDFFTENPNGKIVLGCLEGCGNAIESQTDYVFGGSHAQNWIQESVGSIDFYKYTDMLKNEIKKDYGEYSLISGEYDLSHYDKLIKSALKNSKISSYTIGRNLME